METTAFRPLLYVTYLCLQAPLKIDYIPFLFHDGVFLCKSNLMALWARKHPVHDEQLNLHGNFVAHG